MKLQSLWKHWALSLLQAWAGLHSLWFFHEKKAGQALAQLPRAEVGSPSLGDLTAMCRWHLGTGVRAEFGSTEGVGGLGYLGGFFQLK